MQELIDKKWEFNSWLKTIIVLLLVCSVFFKFVNIDKKVYTIDEVRGLLRVSGYTLNEYIDRVYNGSIITAADLQKYQRPNGEKNLTDAVNALAGNPEHPPLYYLMARFAIQLWGNPVGARILTALISLLAFPAIYWLCLELFDSPQIGWTAIALMAVSPYHLMLAQEARQYSLWTVATLLSSAAFLQAMRLSAKRNWVIYAATVALGIYSHLFFVFVSIGHGIYIVLIEGWQFRKKLISYLLASLAGVLAFIPWILVVATKLKRLEETTSWVGSYQTSIVNRIEYWLHNFSVIFIDFQQDSSWTNPLPYLSFILVAASIYFLSRQTPQRIWLFVFLLMGVTALGQIFPDIILGGRRSLFGRYLLPSYLGIQLGVAYLVVNQINTISPRRQRLWQIILAILISVGVLSSAASSQASDWWKGSTSINLPVAAVIDQSTKPLLIADNDKIFTLPLSYMIDSDVSFQLFNFKEVNQLNTKLNLPYITEKFSNIFLYFPSQNLRDRVEKEFKLRQVLPDQPILWEIAK